MGLRAGLLREKIAIKTPAVTRDAYGAEVVTYGQPAYLRARVVFRSGNRGDINHEIQNPYRVEFVVRTTMSLTPQMLLTWRGNDYRIITINYEKYKQQQTIVGEVVNE